MRLRAAIAEGANWQVFGIRALFVAAFVAIVLYALLHPLSDASVIKVTRAHGDGDAYVRAEAIAYVQRSASGSYIVFRDGAQALTVAESPDRIAKAMGRVRSVGEE